MPNWPPLEVDDAVFLCLSTGHRVTVGQPATSRGPGRYSAHGAGHPVRHGVEAQVAAHDAHAVIAVAREVVERGVDPPEQPGGDQRQLDLFVGVEMILLGDLDLQPLRAGAPMMASASLSLCAMGVSSSTCRPRSTAFRPTSPLAL